MTKVVQRNDLGRVRVHCDADGCERKFVPRSPRTDYTETRRRAELYGWVSLKDDAGELQDLCPACRPAQLAAAS